jgi:methylthioribose-1-phosphate isomerase
VAPAGVRVYNPAFDLTPAEHISAIVTERGVLYPPFGRAIAGLG